MYESLVLSDTFSSNKYLQEMICAALYWTNYYLNNEVLDYTVDEFAESESDGFGAYAKAFQRLIENKEKFSELSLNVVNRRKEKFPDSEAILLFAGKLNFLEDFSSQAINIFEEYLQKFPNGKYHLHVNALLKEIR
ncbi:MAG: hypothetical protein K1X55_03360 [Chitinophagales bacterium]|nr:hypothetical protein [Chitinophagales bacterium]